MPENIASMCKMSRRSFFKATAVTSAALTTGLVCSTAMQSKAKAEETEAEEEIKYSNCRNACQGGCSHQYTVRNGVVVNARPAECPDSNYTGICLRGLNNIARTYCKERVCYPMRRVDGTERGAGQWERISWDEAIEEIAGKADILPRHLWWTVDYERRPSRQPWVHQRAKLFKRKVSFVRRYVHYWRHVRPCKL